MKTSFWVGATAVAASCSSVVAAQWLTQVSVQVAAAAQVRRCLKGKMSVSENEVDEARQPAKSLMNNYWARAAVSDAADIAPAFQSGGGNAIWVDGSSELTVAGMRQVRDPFARNAELVLSAEPSSFARSAAEHNNYARGVWPVYSRADAAKVAGYYVVDLQRSMFKWGISRIVLVHTPAEVPVARPFCALPGDIEEYVAARAEKEAQKAAKRAAQETAH